MWDEPFNLIDLTEHQVKLVPKSLVPRIKDLEDYLDTVWKNRPLLYEEDPEQTPTRQRYLRFELVHGNLTMRAGQYVGFIQFEGYTIQILPKLFEHEQADKAFHHLLWWLDYGQRLNFPIADLVSGSEPIESFPEALIRYFARFTESLISSQPYHQYQEVTETMSYVRGRLNTQEYVNNSMSRGNWHQLICNHEPFLFNNRLNQIIKHVTRFLLDHCKQSESRRELGRILFILDEVDDLICTVEDCDRVQLNRFFQEYESCLAMCRFFLSNQYMNRQNDQQRHFCFLVPMDVVYEDFITGVVKTHFGHKFQVQSQATDWLTEEEVFQIRNDLFLTDRQTRETIIADTKYKVRKVEPGDKKAGISQADLYQMVSYGLRRNTRQILLLYPVKYGQPPTIPVTFTVNSVMMGNQPIRIQATDLTITGNVTSQQEFTQHIIEETLVPQLAKAFKQLEIAVGE
jgi:5-methylcytosine-specific restriction enzyme subunit McrC